MKSVFLKATPGCLALLILLAAAGNNVHAGSMPSIESFITDVVDGKVGPVMVWTDEEASAGTSYNIYAAEIDMADFNGVQAVPSDAYVLIGSTTSMSFQVNPEVLPALYDNAYIYYVVGVDEAKEGTPSNKVLSAFGRGTYSRAAIVSQPNSEVALGAPYIYDVNALGEDQHTASAVVFELTMAPMGVHIDATSGVITWTPVANGSFDMSVKVTDPKNGDFESQSWTVTVSGTSSVDGTERTVSAIAYPNPAASSVTFRLEAQAGEGNFVVHNLVGNVVYENAVNLVDGENTINLDVNSFAAGLYFLKVDTGNRALTLPFRVTR